MSTLPETPDGMPNAAQLIETFDSPAPFTVGLEEEVMVLDRASLDLAPTAGRLLERLSGDRRFKAEMPACQLEILTEPAARATDALAALAVARHDLAEAADGVARLAGAGAHPFAPAEGELSESPRYERIGQEYGRIARRQLISSLQVHVAVGDAQRTLRVYNGLRERLPELTALAANAPFHEGKDTGLASVRPKIAELLPRQGVPPPIESWEGFADELRWGAVSGAVPEPRHWWWELRPNVAFGTLEVRVPDAQTTLADAGAIAATVQALAVHLAEREPKGAPAPGWRIEENRWSATGYGVEGEMADLTSGELEPTRARLHRMLGEIEPAAERLGSMPLLAEARRLVEQNGAITQRRIVAERSLEGLVGWLCEAFSGSFESSEGVLPERPSG